MPVYHFTSDIENRFRHRLPEEYAFQVTLESNQQLHDNRVANVAGSFAAP